MQAVETLQKANSRSSRSQENRPPLLSSPSTPIISSRKQFQPSETSAFIRPPSRTSSKTSAAVSAPSPRPKPLPRSSSLQKVSSDYSCPSPCLQTPAPFSDVHTQHYPDSSVLSHSCRSPVGSAPSLTLSSSSSHSISASSSPTNTPDHKQPKEEHKTFHNLKNFWTSAAQKHEGPCPASLLQGGNKKMSTVQKDVLGLLNLSPQHKPSTKRTEEPNAQSNHNGHQKHVRKPSPPHESTFSKDKHLAGNKCTFFSPGNLFPSSKC